MSNLTHMKVTRLS